MYLLLNNQDSRFVQTYDVYTINVFAKTLILVKRVKDIKKFIIITDLGKPSGLNINAINPQINAYTKVAKKIFIIKLKFSLQMDVV